MGSMFHTSASKDPGAWRSDRIGLVQKEQSNSAGRGYLLDIELASHPAYLAALYEAFCHTGAADQPLTARKVPLFARRRHPEQLLPRHAVAAGGTTHGRGTRRGPHRARLRRVLRHPQRHRVTAIRS